MGTINEIFVPEIWSARLLDHLDSALVYGNAINRNWESEIKRYGDTIRINQVDDVAIFDYTANTDFASGPDSITGTQITLLIDQGKAFNFSVDSIENAQSNPKLLDYAMQRAAYALAAEMDSFIAGMGVGATNAIGTLAAAVVPTATDIYGYFTEAAMLLDEANVPTFGRFAIVPSFILKLLRDSGDLLADTTVGDRLRAEGVMANGTKAANYYGNVAGFNVYTSNKVPTDGTTYWESLFGYDGALTVADQFVEIKGYEPEKRFGQAVKGLHVYGGQLVQPEGLVKAYFAK